MRAIKTHELTPGSIKSESEKLWVYCALDTCVTMEVLEAMLPQLNNQTRATYEFEKSLLAPVLEINMRGILVDIEERDRSLSYYRGKLHTLEHNLNRILREGVGVELNWRSHQQLKHLFYNIFGFPPIHKDGKVTVNRDALEKLEVHFYPGPIIRHILAMRDIAKKIEVLEADIDTDGRLRTSINIAGTNTGRVSSAMSDFGTGRNLQNIEEQMRRPFIADPGMKLAYIDLEQAESRAVGAIEWNVLGDSRYLDACESGDLHTSVARMMYPALPWTGNAKLDKQIAERPFYRQHSLRHMTKVLGHGSNYGGKPGTMAKHTKMDRDLIAEFQEKYFDAFPHRQWHTWVNDRLGSDGYLDTLTGRRRWFFGRRTDDSTLREAIAYSPQGSVGDILNMGMLQVWRQDICLLLLQIHDAILIQFPEEKESETISKVTTAIQVEIELAHGRTLRIPCEAKTGWNWSPFSEENPDGLMKYGGEDKRKRQQKKPLNILDRIR
jgi:DNA polymerase I-like protein with 3'-5' exonuclease and polymerase domains